MLKARPHGSRINDQKADGPRMTRIVDFGWSRQSPDPDRISPRSLLYVIETAYSLHQYCCTAMLDRTTIRLLKLTLRFQLPTDTDCWCSLAFIQEGPPGGVDYKSERNKLSVSFSRPGEPLSTSLPWPSRRPLIHILPCYAMGSYTIAKISIDLALPFQPVFHGLFQAVSILNKCKKLNSLKHLVRTTVAGSHN